MNPFTILFPSFCDGRREPDPEFQKQAIALEELGIPIRVVDIEALEAGDAARSLRHFGPAPEGTLIYRGWILRPSKYALLHRELSSRGYTCLTNPRQYRQTVLFPEFYPAIAEHSFPAAWIKGHDAKKAWEAAKSLGPPPYFIKDFTKSAKEIWPEGCVVTGEEGEAGMARAVKALRRYRGKRFQGGIVVRPLVRLQYIGEDPFGGAIYEEYRLFFLRGELITRHCYGREGGDAACLPDYGFLGERVKVPFFTADIVRTEEGTFHVLEIGDGGTSGLPPTLAPLQFYGGLRERMARLSQ